MRRHYARRYKDFYISYLMTIDDFKRPSAHHLNYPIVSRNPVDFDNSLLLRKPPRTYI